MGAQMVKKLKATGGKSKIGIRTKKWRRLQTYVNESFSSSPAVVPCAGGGAFFCSVF
jgi:hypothetical protein